MSNLNNTVIFEGFSGSEVAEIVKTYGDDFNIRVEPDGTQVVSKSFTADLVALVEGSKRQLGYDLKIVEVISDNLGELEYQRDYLDAVINNKELSKDDVLDRLRVVHKKCEDLIRGLTEETRVEVPEGYVHQGLSVNTVLPIVKEFVAKVRELQGKVDSYRATL